MTPASALQLHYTSCERGLTGCAGFQTRAETPGLAPEDRAEVEGLLLYRAPRGLPREPDAETIRACFPTVFKVAGLASGRTALIRSVYLGRDYSGRWGNFFAHALILDGPLEDRWPIDAYPWPGWAGGNEAEGIGEPGPLPRIPQSAFASGQDFSFPELRAFLREAPGRRELLAHMIRAVFLRGRDARSLVIRECEERPAIYWLACVQKAFPPGSQERLTCSTFQFDPGSALALNATLGDTDFRFDDRERNRQFHVFDFTTGEHPSLQGGPHGYAETLADWMSSDPARVAAFHRFAGAFGPVGLGPELGTLLHLFQLEGDEAPAMSRSLPEADLSALLAFALARAAATGLPAHGHTAVLAWLQAFDQGLEEPAGAAPLLALRREVEAIRGSDPCDLARSFLADDHLDRLCAAAGEREDRALGLVLAELDRSCRKLGKMPTFEAREVLGFIEAVLYHRPGPFPDLQWAFLPYLGQVEGLAAIISHVAGVLQEQGEVPAGAHLALGRSLSAALAKGSTTVHRQLIEHLKLSEPFWEVLFGEWADTLERSADKPAAHARYAQSHLADGSPYAQAMVDRMAAALLDLLPAGPEPPPDPREDARPSRLHRVMDRLRKFRP